LKIQCHAGELQEAVSVVSSIVSTNTTRPILQSIHIRAGDEGMVLQATDLELGLAVRVDGVMVEEPGEVAVSAGRLHAILRELPGEQVSFSTESDSSQLVIEAASSRFKVPCSAADEFPKPQFQPPSPSIRVSRQRFLESLKCVSIAAARDATRFQMHAVLLECRDDGLRMVSTDGKRLALGNCAIPTGAVQGVQNPQHIVPLKGVHLLLRVLGMEEAEEVELHLDQSSVAYNSDRISLSCRLVEGHFPDYERAVPASGEHVYEISKDELLVALRQASLMTTKESNSVTFKFDSDSLVLSTSASALGESRVELAASPVGLPVDDFQINFNPGYIIDLLKVHDGPVLRASFKDRKTAGVFTGGEESPYRHIIMPLVTQE